MMVIVDGDKRVAVECDGERWHSTDLQVRGDMERQTILERLGWRFIRIRGSEYFRDPDGTMDRVYAEIESLGIHPAENHAVECPPDTDLLTSIKARAEELLAADGYAVDAGDAQAAIEFALNPDDAPDGSTFGTNMHNRKGKDIRSTRDKAIVPTHTQPQKADTSNKPASTSPKNRPTSARTKPSPRLRNQGTLFDAADVREGSHATNVVELIEEAGIQYVDNRSSKGVLWIVGGMELEPFVQKCRELGLQFVFMRGGGRATNNQDAWWAK